MSRGYYVPCAPYLYLVPEAGGRPGMDCLPLQQRAPGPFQYLIHEQAKSLVALQELQNEVGALLEFRDLVMETFPHLRNKMATLSSSSASTSHISSPSTTVSNIPVPLTSSLASVPSRREWEPGIRVRRKLAQKDPDISVSSLASTRSRTKPHTQQPKSGEGINSGSGTSSAGSSAVQDSGFGTETSSSKEHCHSSSSTGAAPTVPRAPSPKTSGTETSVELSGAAGPSPLVDEADDELWNLLDIIHTKGTKLRDEVVDLRQRIEENEKLGTVDVPLATGRELRRRSLDDGLGTRRAASVVGDRERCDRKTSVLLDLRKEGERRCDSLDEEEVRGLRRERDLLLDKVAEMEAETLASRVRTSQLQSELECLVAAKRDVEEQLRAAVTQKTELNSRIHDLHLQFVSGTKNSASNSSANSPLCSDASSRKLVLVPGSKKPLLNQQTAQGQSSPPSQGVGSGRGPSCFTPVASPRCSAQDGSTKAIASNGHDKKGAAPYDEDDLAPTPNPRKAQFQRHDTDSSASDGGGEVRLGTLDGIVSSPSRLARYARGIVPDPNKVAAILQEFNPVELQRHLLTTSVEKQALKKQLQKSAQSQVDLVEQLDKVKDENEDLRFQLEEKNIELEGTRARVRVLERLHQKSATVPESSTDLPPILPQDAMPNPVIPMLALPMPADDNVHHSSSTESAHDHTACMNTEHHSTDQEEMKKASQPQQMSPRRRPSKIPLPGTKSYCAPKPPSGKAGTLSAKPKDSPSWKNRTDSSSSFSGKVAGGASLRNRSDSNSSLCGGKSRESVSGGRSSSLSVRNGRDSLNTNKGRDSLSGRNRNDSLGGKRSNSDSISSGKGRDASFSSNISAANKRESLSGKMKDSSTSSPGGRKGLHHQMSTRRVSNASATRGNLIEQGDQNSKEETSGDAEEKSDSCDNITDQPGESFSDSLNYFPTQELFKSTADLITTNTSMSDQQIVYQATDPNITNAFPWHSSSSEYFDSINNSGSVFNNSSMLRSCSYFQEQFHHSSSRHEGLAECDSLETSDTGGEDIAAKLVTPPTRNIWSTAEKLSEKW